ncbi:MAG TPA: Uma2 family endonuclease [Blastocatellia bacterium]|nr:Uma2 family endonuclease [Blastocatellia bacterium]
MTTKHRATVQDLYNIPEHGKAEIVNGEIVRLMPTGAMPGRAAGFIYSSLLDHERRTKSGHAFPDNVGFIVDLPNRDSFSPDAAWYVGEVTSMGFLEGPPAFAVEVRSENDYGPAAERQLASKRLDYFAAGTQVVWDVDLLGDDAIITVYRSEDPDHPTTYARGEIAQAEPAVPGWTMPVDLLFD